MEQQPSGRLGRPVYVVDGSRTPFLKARGKPGPFTAADLAVAGGNSLLARQPFSPDAFDEVILGCVMPSASEANIARVVALRLGCGDRVPAWTVQRNCASGMQALDAAAGDIASGRAGLVLAGGVEVMSHAPILFSDAMVNWLAAWIRARTPVARLKALLQLRPAHLRPVIGLLRGLTDPVVGLSMGQTAEILAHRFAIGAHRARRKKGITASPLDEVPGIGPARKRALLKHFGSAKAVSRAGIADLESVGGISAQMAKAIYDHFHERG